jgi:hypothetical protein
MHDTLRRLHRAADGGRALVLLSVALAVLAQSACQGCGNVETQPQVDAGPPVNVWTARSDEALTIALGEAQREATRRHRRVLLVFVGFGDADSEAVIRLLAEPSTAAVLRERYVPVYVNVGREGVDHTRLRHAHDVRKLATLVVLEASGRRVARQTFAPVSDVRTLSAETLAQWLSAPRGR